MHTDPKAQVHFHSKALTHAITIASKTLLYEAQFHTLNNGAPLNLSNYYINETVHGTKPLLLTPQSVGKHTKH